MQTSIEADPQHVDSELNRDLTKLCAEPAFAELEKELKEFNPFRVLKVERYELRHTTTLAWLLDPHETHGMGDVFLKSFLRTVAPCNDTSWTDVGTGMAEVLGELRFDKAKGFLASIGKDATAEGFSETADRLDVLVCGMAANYARWGVAIEAKIDSKEGENQLRQYDVALGKMFGKNDRVMKLYLTVQPVEKRTSSDSWINIQWGHHVAKALDDAVGLMSAIPGGLDGRVAQFLQDYRALLRGLSNSETSDFVHRVHAFANNGCVARVLRELETCVSAKDVVRCWGREDWVGTYWKHRAMLDMCMAQVRPHEAAFVWDKVIKALAGDNEWHIITPFNSKNATVDFVPTEWLAYDNLRTKDGRWNLCYHAEFRNAYQDVEVKLYLPATGEKATQKALLIHLLKEESRATLSSHLSPRLNRQLKQFLEPDSASTEMKLYTVSANWKRHSDGTYHLDAERNQKKFKEYLQFSTAAAAHRAAIRAVIPNVSATLQP